MTFFTSRKKIEVLPWVFLTLFGENLTWDEYEQRWTDTLYCWSLQSKPDLSTTCQRREQSTIWDWLIKGINYAEEGSTIIFKFRKRCWTYMSGHVRCDATRRIPSSHWHLIYRWSLSRCALHYYVCWMFLLVSYALAMGCKEKKYGVKTSWGERQLCCTILIDPQMYPETRKWICNPPSNNACWEFCESESRWGEMVSSPPAISLTSIYGFSNYHKTSFQPKQTTLWPPWKKF